MITSERQRSAFRNASPKPSLGLQCLACGYVEEPARDPYRCPWCGGLDIHVWATDRTPGRLS